VRPLVSSAAKGFAGIKTSGVVPVDVYGCSVLSSLLRGGEEGLDYVLPSLSKVLLTKIRDPYVILFFMGSFVITCTCIVINHEGSTPSGVLLVQKKELPHNQGKRWQRKMMSRAKIPHFSLVVAEKTKELCM
jgi:hypothetical protein